MCVSSRLRETLWLQWTYIVEEPDGRREIDQTADGLFQKRHNEGLKGMTGLEKKRADTANHITA